MGGVALDKKTVGLLMMLRDRLVSDPHSGMGRGLPRWLPDGSEVKTVEQLATLLGTDRKTAAIAVLQCSDATPTPLRLEAKDIYAGLGSHNVSVGVGTVVSRGKVVQRAKRTLRNVERRKRRKRREKKK